MIDHMGLQFQSIVDVTINNFMIINANPWCVSQYKYVDKCSGDTVTHNYQSIQNQSLLQGFTTPNEMGMSPYLNIFL